MFFISIIEYWNILKNIGFESLIYIRTLYWASKLLLNINNIYYSYHYKNLPMKYLKILKLVKMLLILYQNELMKLKKKWMIIFQIKNIIIKL